MVDYNAYIPILKWKQGEYQALNNLSDDIKRHIMPLIEITPIGYDHENKKDSKTIDDHISTIGSRLKKKWGSYPCFVDFTQLQLQKIQKGEDYINKIFTLYRSENCTVIPVVELDFSNLILDKIKEVIKIDKQGVCLRIKSKYIGDNNLNTKIDNFISNMGIAKAEIDLLIDFEVLPENAGYLNFAISSIKNINQINLWRSFIVAGSSFPKDTSKSSKNIQRIEWSLYKKCYENFVDAFRLPSFSDYGINRPEHLDLDMRVIKPFAKMRYTLDDKWYINVGGAVRGPKSRGFGQFQNLCQELVEENFYRGKEYSAGDKYINDCAKGVEGTGNLSTWVCVSTNQHLVKIVNDLSSLYGFSI